MNDKFLILNLESILFFERSLLLLPSSKSKSNFKWKQRYEKFDAEQISNCLCIQKLQYSKALKNILTCFCIENVALHKPTWQMRPHRRSEFNSSLAVDGQRSDLSLFGGDCVASGNGITAEWRVDLESVLSIHHIVVQYTQGKPVIDTVFVLFYFLLLHILLSLKLIFRT